jgi:hypothetical protein
MALASWRMVAAGGVRHATLLNLAHPKKQLIPGFDA